MTSFLPDGRGLNAHSWDTTALHLGVAASAFDLPGHGHSAWRPDATYTPNTIAQDISAVMSGSDSDGRQLLVGHSLGGLAALRLTQLLPARVSALVMIDVTPTPDPVALAKVKGFLPRDVAFDSYAHAINWAKERGLGATSASLERGIRFNMREREDGRVVFRHHLAHLPPDEASPEWDSEALWSAVDSLTVPLLVIRGSQGFVSETKARAFRERTPTQRS